MNRSEQLCLDVMDLVTKWSGEGTRGHDVYIALRSAAWAIFETLEDYLPPEELARLEILAFQCRKIFVPVTLKAEKSD